MEGLRWIIHGNIVIPTHNPFLKTTAATDANDKEPIGTPTNPATISDARTATSSTRGNVRVGPGIEIKVDHIIAVNAAGIIARLEPAEDFFAIFPREDVEGHEGYLRLEEEGGAGGDAVAASFLCPGAIDLHVHAPQYAFAGTGTDRPLMGDEGWLATYTFPVESSMRDLDLARNVYEKVVKRTLDFGTTTAVYFATLDLEPTKILVDSALRRGQRALIGKVCMDRNAPPTYCQSTDQNLQETVALISYIRNHHSQPKTRITAGPTPRPLVFPLVTPRFIPTCTPALMGGLAKIARDFDCHITSHVSESIDEVTFSRELARQDYGGVETLGASLSDSDLTDARVFDFHGLLTDKCIMAHGVYLSDSDWDLMRRRGAAVAHCPLSNFYFAGGSLPCKRLLHRGNKVGLGTDIAGGYHPSILDSAKAAVLASLSLQHQRNATERARTPKCERDDDDDPALNFQASFYLATLGGAEALGMEDRIGSFRVGMEFDAMVLTSSSSSSYLPDIFPSDSLTDKFQKLWILGDDRNISRVFVQGRQVKQCDA